VRVLSFDKSEERILNLEEYKIISGEGDFVEQSLNELNEDYKLEIVWATSVKNSPFLPEITMLLRMRKRQVTTNNEM